MGTDKLCPHFHWPILSSQLCSAKSRRVLRTHRIPTPIFQNPHRIDGDSTPGPLYESMVMNMTAIQKQSTAISTVRNWHRKGNEPHQFGKDHCREHFKKRRNKPNLPVVHFMPNLLLYMQLTPYLPAFLGSKKLGRRSQIYQTHGRHMLGCFQAASKRCRQTPSLVAQSITSAAPAQLYLATKPILYDAINQQESACLAC